MVHVKKKIKSGICLVSKCGGENWVQWMNDPKLWKRMKINCSIRRHISVKLPKWNSCMRISLCSRPLALLLSRSLLSHFAAFDILRNVLIVGDNTSTTFQWLVANGKKGKMEDGRHKQRSWKIEKEEEEEKRKLR